jgi:hypothetical protein
MTRFKYLLTKKMTRKQFLVYTGLLVVSVFGISSFLNNISAIYRPNKVNKIPKKTSFGSGAYGV